MFRSRFIFVFPFLGLDVAIEIDENGLVVRDSLAKQMLPKRRKGGHKYGSLNLFDLEMGTEADPNAAARARRHEKGGGRAIGGGDDDTDDFSSDEGHVEAAFAAAPSPREAELAKARAFCVRDLVSR
jgi:hypothetical protein